MALPRVLVVLAVAGAGVALAARSRAASGGAVPKPGGKPPPAPPAVAPTADPWVVDLPGGAVTVEPGPAAPPPAAPPAAPPQAGQHGIDWSAVDLDDDAARAAAVNRALDGSPLDRANLGAILADRGYCDQAATLYTSAEADLRAAGWTTSADVVKAQGIDAVAACRADNGSSVE